MDSEEPMKESSQPLKEEDIAPADVTIEGNNQGENIVDQLEEIDTNTVEHDKAIDCPLQDSEVKEAQIVNNEAQVLNNEAQVLNNEASGDLEGDDSDVGSVSSVASQEVPTEREEGDGQEEYLINKMDSEEPMKESSQPSKEEDIAPADVTIEGNNQGENIIDQLEEIDTNTVEHDEAIDEYLINKMDSEEPMKESSQPLKEEDIAPADVTIEGNNQGENIVDQLEEIDTNTVEHDKAIDCPLQDSEVKEAQIVNNEAQIINNEALIVNHEAQVVNNEASGDLEGDDSDVGSVSSVASQEVPIEREEGDGQESDKKDKKLDRDEDKRDPQYIPKKGNFYEHDDRTSEGEEPSNGKKHLTPKAFESKERWGHDLYDDSLQSPKSREELIEQYGYDIRLEEGPPKARRRRRYGRGPNKYTRRWEEEEAYAKSRGSWRGRGRGRPSRNSVEDFPPLPEKEAVVKAAIDEIKSENKQDSIKKDPIRMSDNKIEKKDALTEKQSVRRVKIDETTVQSASLPRGRGSTRGRGKVSQPFKSGSFHRQSSTAEEDIATLSKHFAEAVINVDNKSIPSKRASSVPPTNSSELNGIKNHQSSDDSIVDKSGAESKSKRYSMQRQRSLPQATTNGVGIVQQAPQPPPPPPHYIQPDQQQYFHQVGLDATPGAPANQYTNQAPANYRPEVPPMVAFVSTAAHQFHQPLPTYLPPTYLTPPPLPTPPRGPEVYQGPTGITYYNTQSQVSRPVSTSRRVRLAIPIVAPPPESS